MMRPIFLLALPLIFSQLPACSSEQVYHMGQMWQKGECNKIGDAAERSRCLGNTNTSYEQYQRQREGG